MLYSVTQSSNAPQSALLYEPPTFEDREPSMTLCIRMLRELVNGIQVFQASIHSPFKSKYGVNPVILILVVVETVLGVSERFFGASDQLLVSCIK